MNNDTTSVSEKQINAYLSGACSFIPDLMPSDAVKMSEEQVMHILSKKLGYNFFVAFSPEKTILSPLENPHGDTNGTAEVQTEWLKRSKMVGINVRTIQSFWNVVKYALTLPEAQQAIHLLPIWEPGVVASLYGMSSWNINPEFFSPALYYRMPHLDTVEKQLKVLVNVLHALGKVVGMDVIPHTDRFSEQVIANPHYFEWLQRLDTDIVRQDNNLHETVQGLILNFIKKDTPSVLHYTKEYFFSKNFSEKERLRLLFGEPKQYQERLTRRIAIMECLIQQGFETVPATMGPPYRGIAVDTEGGIITDEMGRTWRDFKITKPEKFSRVFGPLTRYKLYENKDNNADWAIDFTKPIPEAWAYVAQHYAEVRRIYNLDFMRGDMAHVQMRPEGVPVETDDYYDLLCYIKKYIQKRAPYFANFAETFLAPAGEMAYGDEVDHLEMSAADSTLGDLQSMVVGSKRFMTEFHRYLDILHTRKVAPNFTILTGDKDDPRFDEFYLKGNEIRYFIALFLSEMPSYMGLGFEQRNPHPTPAPNEHYTKLYVFHLEESEKATKTDYIWGVNKTLFNNLHRMKLYSDEIAHEIQNADCQWLMLPNANSKNKVIAWTCGNYLFVANLDIDKAAENITISDVKTQNSKLETSNTPPPAFIGTSQYKSDFSITNCDFSTVEIVDSSFSLKNSKFVIDKMEEGEGRVYKIG